MLLTEQQLSRRRRISFPQPERIKKVRKSMGAIKQVLGERKRDHLSQLALRRLNVTKHDSGDEEPEEKQG
jgi:Mitochondrial 39-S ribosomal protein L47 (MRP-L47)